MKNFSLSHIPFLSFFSKELYKDAALNWKGTGFGYLLLLLAVCIIPSMAQFHLGVVDFIDNQAPKFVKQIPGITIRKGEVSIKQAQPCYIKDPDTGKDLFILDTTGTVTSLDGTDALGLVTKTKLIFKNNKTETRILDLAEVKELVLEPANIEQMLKIARNFLALFIYPWVLLAVYIFRIIQALIYALLGLALASLFNLKLSYASLIRLAVVAVTPCLIIKAVLVLVSIDLPGLFYLLAACGYLFFGIKAVAQAGQSPVLPGNDVSV